VFLPICVQPKALVFADYDNCVKPPNTTGSQVPLPGVRHLTSFAGLRAELAQCSAPVYAGATDDVFASLAWFELLAQHGMAAPDQCPANCHLLLVHDEARQSLVCLPLTFGRSINNISSLSNYYSGLYSALCWSGHNVAAAQALPSPQDCQALSHSLRQLAPGCALVTLYPLALDSAFFGRMHAALSQAGYWVDRYFCFGNWYLPVAGRSFADYYPTLPSALRHSIERGQRRLQRQGPWQIDIHQQLDDGLDAAIRAFVQVYARSWKKPEPNAQFIPALIKLAAGQGWLRLGILTLDGQPVAAQLWLVKGGKANIFKLAYEQGFERFSAGSVLTQAMLRHVLDVDRVHEVDYLSGDDAYKRDWMSHRRERHGLVAFAPHTVRGVWLAARHFAGKCLNQWCHQ